MAVQPDGVRHDRYSAMGALADDGPDFDPDPAPECGGAASATAAAGDGPAKEDPAGAAGPLEQPDLAGFRELYRSRDGRLLLFEDAHGHLTAVNAARLA